MRYVIESAAVLELARQIRADKTDFVEIELLDAGPSMEDDLIGPSVLFCSFRRSAPDKLYGFQVECVPKYSDAPDFSEPRHT